MIKDIINSPVKTKKFRAIMSDNRKIDFGLKGSSTYLDHKDKTKRNNYRARHLRNDRENYLIKNIIHLRPYYPIIYYGVHILLYIKILIT